MVITPYSQNRNNTRTSFKTQYDTYLMKYRDVVED